MSTWLITGGCSVLGRALATAALDAGDAIVATPAPGGFPADPTDLDLLADLVDRFGPQVRVLDRDVADPAAAAEAVQLALDAFGGLDVVVTSAGQFAPVPIAELSLDGLRAEVEGGLLGTVSLARAALPVFQRQGSGHFLQLSSADRGASSRAVAAATAGFAESLQVEAAPHGVRVTVVEAGAFPSVGVSSAGRVGDPERAARVLLDVVAMEQPPRHLPLGSDALRAARQTALARVQEAELWGDVSRSTDAGSTVRGLASVLHLAS